MPDKPPDKLAEKLTEQQVRHVAKLSRLRLSDQEVAAYTERLSAVLDYISKIDELGRKLTAYSFRHTYATLLAEHVGHNPFILKEVLGHSRLSMTERYCHPTAPSLELALSGIKIPEFGASRGASKGCQSEQTDPQAA